MLIARIMRLSTLVLPVLIAVMTFAVPHPAIGQEHSAFDAVLKAHVDDKGLVDYAALKGDPASLNAYLDELASADVDTLSDEEALALWINAYNAYALKLIIETYPIDSILKTAGTAFIPNAEDAFDAPFATVGGQDYSLNQIENEVIRVQFDEPRIHFAVVCAAMDCPPLRAEAYTAAALDGQLEEQAQRFITDEAKNRIPADASTIRLSQIFNWYMEDFGGTPETLQAYLAPYTSGAIKSRLERGAYDVEFLEYDWALNAQAPPGSSAR